MNIAGATMRHCHGPFFNKVTMSFEVTGPTANTSFLSVARRRQAATTDRASPLRRSGAGTPSVINTKQGTLRVHRSGHTDSPGRIISCWPKNVRTISSTTIRTNRSSSPWPTSVRVGSEARRRTRACASASDGGCMHVVCFFATRVGYEGRNIGANFNCSRDSNNLI
jgi:hypothetical protein